jgi:hypothetical protein
MKMVSTRDIIGRGDRDADWFGFKHKNHPNHEIKMQAVRFGSVGFKKLSKPNQTNAARIGSVVAVYDVIFRYQTILNIAKKNLNFLSNIKVPIKVVYPK